VAGRREGKKNFQFSYFQINQGGREGKKVRVERKNQIALFKAPKRGQAELVKKPQRLKI